MKNTRFILKNKSTLALLLTLLTSTTLMGCADRFRYPCQDPAKTNSAECQCNQEPRTKNKALGAVESAVTTTTLKEIVGLDC